MAVDTVLQVRIDKKTTNAAGMLNKYADKSKRRLEKETVERCLVDKHRRKN